MSGFLVVEGVSSGYGLASVLHNVSLHVDKGEVVAVLGANGAGKTTLLRTIYGLIAPTTGRVIFEEKDIGGTPAHLVVSLGLAMVPEGGRLFPFMTVKENLELGAFNPASRAETAAQSRRSPHALSDPRPARLAARRLAFGRRAADVRDRAGAYEPSAAPRAGRAFGRLSPVMVEKVFEFIRSVVASRHLTILLVEQHVEDALEIANRAYVIERGELVKTGTGSALAQDPDIQRAYMGL